jgi:hypothetical protein
VFDYIVVQEVVIEVALSHPPDQVIQLLLRIFREPRGRKRSIVPVVAGDESLKPEWLPCNGGVHSATAFGVRLEGSPATPPFYLISLSTTSEIVLVGVDREQHAEVAVGIHLKDQQVAVLLCSHLNRGVIAREKTSVVTEPELDWGIVVRCSGRLSRAGIRCEQKR